MKKIKIMTLLIILSTLLIGLTLSSVFAQKETNENICSQEKEGVKVCVTLNRIDAKLNEDVKLSVSLWNLSSQKLLSGSPLLFEYKLNKETGEKLPTIFEKRILDSGTALNGEIEWKTALSGGSSHRSFVAVGESQVQEVNLSKVYEFSEKGKYTASIKTKLPNKDGNGFYELVIEAIEIEVK
jgi:hypothetical protein